MTRTRQQLRRLCPPRLSIAQKTALWRLAMRPDHEMMVGDGSVPSIIAVALECAGLVRVRNRDVLGRHVKYAVLTSAGLAEAKRDVSLITSGDGQ